MSEKEIDLSVGSHTQDSGSTNTAPDKTPEIKQHVGDLSGIIKPGMSDKELVAAITQAPTSSLIPWEKVELPSKGLYYGWDSGVIRVRAFGANVEKIIANQRLAASGQTIEYIFNECCEFPEGFSQEDLIVGDQIFLLFYLRGITHGPMYDFTIKCTNEDCGFTSMKFISLAEVANTIKYADPNLGSEPFTITLPTISEIAGRPVWVKVRFLRVSDTSTITRLRKAKRRSTEGNGVTVGRKQRLADRNRTRATGDLDDSFTRNLETAVVEVMGETNRNTIASFLDKLQQSDLAVIRDWLDENTPSIDPVLRVKCSECGTEYITSLPLTESFFRPERRSGSGD